MSNTRFTAWLSSEERAALRKLAAREQCSENFVVRMAVRSLLFGAPVPSYLKQPEGSANEVRSIPR